MATQLTGEALLDADRHSVWTKLNDPAVLQACIPGCKSFETIDPQTFRATVHVKVGPIGATFKVNLKLADQNLLKSYRIEGAGEGGIAGFASGSATVNLSDAANGCCLSYDATAKLGGRIAQLGGRLVNGIAKKYADQFFERFALLLKAETVAREPV